MDENTNRKEGQIPKFKLLEKDVSVVKQLNGTLSKKFIYDAGLDLKSSETLTIPARSSIIIKTGVAIKVPNGFVGLIWSRSGLSVKHKIEVGAGCIDATYRGEVMVHLFNHGDNSYVVHTGDKIAQLLTIPIYAGVYIQVEDLDETDRGDGGFGSTGK